MQKGTVRPLTLKNGDVSWRIQYRDSSRKLVLETLGRESEGWTKKKAQAKLAERISQVANRKWTKPKPLTFEQYAETWFERGQANDRWDTNTVYDYRREKDQLVARFGRTRLGDLKRADIADYFARLSLPGAKSKTEGYSARTIVRRHTILSMILRAAVNDELLDRNPASGVELPKVRSYKPRVLTPAEAQAIEARLVDSQVALAFRVFKFLGLRWCELAQLRWRDLDFVNARLRIVESKTEEGERVIAVPWELLQGFQRHYERSHYKHPDNRIFCNRNSGNRWNPKQYREAVKAAAESLGIQNFRQAHDLRVTSITSGVLVGEHPDKLQARAGHRNYQTTQGYIKLAGKVFQKEADALAAFFSNKPAVEAEKG
jgi:integrase